MSVDSKMKSFPRGKRPKKKAETEPENESETADMVKVKKAKNKPSNDDLFGTKQQQQNLQQKKHKKKKLKPKSANEDDADKGPLKVTFAEPLTYSRLEEGMLILGVINSVGDYDLKVSLPGHLVGVVPIKNVSKWYSDSIVKGQNIRPLSSIFQPGQTVLTAVDRISKDEESNYYKVILSVEPKAVQSGLNPDTLKKGQILQAAVKSVEDHGFVMDVGVKSTRAFLSKKRCPDDENLDVGSVIHTMVTNINSNVVNLTADRHKIRANLMTTDGLTIHTLLPGMHFR